MVTDRKRLRVPGPDTPGWQALSGQTPEDLLVRRVGVAARAGVHLVQVRERDLGGAALLGVVRRCLEVVRLTTTRIVVNERFDVALAAGAHGVHLRGDSMSAARVRALAPMGFLIGRSVHDREEAEGAGRDGGLDYLTFGAVFATRSKPGMAGAGVERLASVVVATGLPVLAVGGVTPETARAIGRAGAAGFAAIGLFADGHEGELGRTVAAAREPFS